MFYHDKELQYTVWVAKPNPLFQAFGSRGPSRYCDMLLETGTEEIGHIGMLATAVALNLEGQVH